MDDAEGERDQFVENLDLAGQFKRVSSRACNPDFELKIFLVPEKTGGHRLQRGGRIAPAEGFPPVYDPKGLIQENGLADFSPEIYSQDHLAFFPFCKESTSMNPVNFLSPTAEEAHPFDCLPEYYTDLGLLLKEN
jgi:hypothetical protein